MKLKPCLVAVGLGLAFLVSSQLSIAATQQEMNQLGERILQEKAAQPIEYGDIAASAFAKNIQKIEKIDDNTERRTYFTILYFQEEEHILIDKGNLIIETWNRQKNIKSKYLWGGIKEIPEGYVVDQITIEDFIFNGKPTSYSKQKIFTNLKEEYCGWNSENFDLYCAEVKKEAQNIYDEHVKEFLADIKAGRL